MQRRDPITGLNVYKPTPDEVSCLRTALEHALCAQTATVSELRRYIGYMHEDASSVLQGVDRNGLLDVYLRLITSDNGWSALQTWFSIIRENVLARAAQAQIEDNARRAYLDSWVSNQHDQSTTLSEIFRKTPYECGICFESFCDPNRIEVVCYNGVGEGRESVQHKACSSCAAKLTSCHVCRGRLARFALPCAWNGRPLEARMGRNPFVVGA